MVRPALGSILLRHPDRNGQPTEYPLRRQIGGARELGLFVAIVALGVVLALLKLANGSSAIVGLGQVLLVLGISILSWRSYELAVGLVILELTVAGASGSWTVFPGAVSGRMVLLAIVFFSGILILWREWRRNHRPELGRYGPHALVVAIVMPLVWVPVGLYYGNARSDILGDANAHMFLAFSLVIGLVLWRGNGPWLRDWVFVACAANAILTGLFILLEVTNVIPLWPTLRGALIDGPGNLGFGGQVGYMPGGYSRLYLGSGLYLQVGLALVAWRLLENPRRWWPWALYGLLLVDVAVSYTRGFWIASVISTGLVMLLAARTWQRPALILAATLAFGLVATVAGRLVDFSVPDYLMQRAASTLVTQPVPTPGQGATPPATAPPPLGSPGNDALGAIGNQIRLDQARILLGHFVERPILGSGFGAIAADYPYAHISRYEISYLELLFDTGLVGFLVFMSLPSRLLFDAVRARLGRLQIATGLSPRTAAVPIAIVASVLVVSATNPYLLAAYGLLPILLSIAWLDPIAPHRPDAPNADVRSA